MNEERVYAAATDVPKEDGRLVKAGVVILSVFLSSYATMVEGTNAHALNTRY